MKLPPVSSIVVFSLFLSSFLFGMPPGFGEKKIIGKASEQQRQEERFQEESKREATTDKKKFSCLEEQKNLYQEKEIAKINELLDKEKSDEELAETLQKLDSQAASDRFSLESEILEYQEFIRQAQDQAERALKKALSCFYIESSHFSDLDLECETIIPGDPWRELDKKSRDTLTDAEQYLKIAFKQIEIERYNLTRLKEIYAKKLANNQVENWNVEKNFSITEEKEQLLLAYQKKIIARLQGIKTHRVSDAALAAKNKDPDCYAIRYEHALKFSNEHKENWEELEKLCQEHVSRTQYFRERWSSLLATSQENLAFSQWCHIQFKKADSFASMKLNYQEIANHAKELRAICARRLAILKNSLTKPDSLEAASLMIHLRNWWFDQYDKAQLLEEIYSKKSIMNSSQRDSNPSIKSAQKITLLTKSNLLKYLNSPRIQAEEAKLRSRLIKTPTLHKSSST